MSEKNEKLEGTSEYIATKIVDGKAMTLGEYDKFRVWDFLENEDPDTEGYIVQYPDGHISWCPKQQFEDANRLTTGMTFGLAVEAMKKGLKVARTGWNRKDMFIVFMSPMSLPARKVNDRTAKWIGEDTPLECNGYFAMFTADKKWQPGWLASQSDMLSDDWQIVD